MPRLFHHLLTQTSVASPEHTALIHKKNQLNYAQLCELSENTALQLTQLGLQSNQRVAIYLPKQPETVISFFATSMAGGVFVPINPLLKPAQVNYILQDCSVSILITSASRYQQLSQQIKGLSQQIKIILTDVDNSQQPLTDSNNLYYWQSNLEQDEYSAHFPPRISCDMAAILYTSGSTGNPKGVVLSHNNLVAGAKSVAEYLNNHAQDKLLAVLPFSFDYGLSQITTAFLSGATVVLMEYLLPRDVIKAVVQHQITGLAAVPPLWIQLAELDWPIEATQSLRYLTNSGGAMPQATLNALREKLPATSPYLMYGLTEAFRSTYLEPEYLDQHPTSMGKAIPDAEILVLNQQGQECEAGEHGELVHRGPHVAMGYWNAPEKTAQRFKPLPHSISHGLTTEWAVYSGDTVMKDEDGFLYFIGRQDDMIKSSGYRISPSEIEECLYQHSEVSEVAALGINHHALGQAVVLVIKPTNAVTFDEQALLQYCKKQLPNFMQPKAIQLKEMLPRNPNGKINRPLLAQEYADLFQ